MESDGTYLYLPEFLAAYLASNDYEAQGIEDRGRRKIFYRFIDTPMIRKDIENFDAETEIQKYIQGLIKVRTLYREFKKQKERGDTN